MKQNIPFWMLLPVILSSCVVSKPDASYISDLDYNQRVEIRNAHYKRRISPLGVGALVAGTAAGGYLGYQSDVIVRQEGDVREPVAEANAAIGALLGFAAVNMTHYLLGLNRTKRVEDQQKWLRRSDKDYLLLRQNSKSDFWAMHQNSEGETYQVRNIQDVQDFIRAFPGSPHSDAVAAKGMDKLARKDLLALLELMPETTHRLSIMEAYARRSRSVGEAVEAFQRFRGLRQVAEAHALTLVRDIGDAEEFMAGFPNTSYGPDVGAKAAPALQNLDETRRFLALFPDKMHQEDIIQALSGKAPRDELPEVIGLLSESEGVIKLQKRYVSESPDIKALFAACRKYPQASFGIDPNLNIYQLEPARKLFYQLKRLGEELGQSNSFQLQLNLKEIYLSHALDQAERAGKIGALERFINSVQAEDWLEKSSGSYLKSARNSIAALQQAEDRRRRQSELAEARWKGIRHLVRFAQQNKGTEEARAAAAEINDFLQRHVLIVDKFIWSAAGDRSWLNDFYEQSRDWISGGDKYNVFVGGVLKNTSNEWLSLKVNARVNMVCLSNFSIIMKRSEQTLDEYYYLELAPGEEAPILTLFRNVSTGTRVGSSLLLSAGSNCDINNDNPFGLEFEYYPENISPEVAEKQYQLMKAAAKAGNLSTRQSPMDNVNRLFNASYDDGYGNLHIYTPMGYQCTITVRDKEGRVVASEQTDDDAQLGRLRTGETYTVDVSGLAVFSIFLDDRIEQRIVDEEGNVEVYQEGN
ncbi:MAG: hypothetical protein H6558_22145 [Lewinellaceae bacterium]|nr:hypothetical protein [Lewinellaceae bacterium]MCB9296426.1 hypothetical protein [Lewinellaceae bacterium]